MQKEFNEVEFLFPKKIDFKDFSQGSSFEPFSDETVNYLNALSKELSKDSRTRMFPDVATFGFFCRRANILSLKKKYYSNDIIRLGRGIIFHVAPSNVPVNFAYSLLSGLLSGNLNIVRVPSKNFEQVDIICDVINKLVEEKSHQGISSKLVLVRYDRQHSVSKFFSSICDVRIIWGGDSTIEQIRMNRLPARSFDVTFADRYSLCVINADQYITDDKPEKIALGFYNDTYLFDQNACTAPHLVIWLGNDENVKVAKKVFWSNLYLLLKTRYSIQPVIAIDKLTTFYYQSAKMGEVRNTATIDNLIWRIELKDLVKEIDEFKCTSGYFSEYHASSIYELSKIINKKYQTLSYYGLSKTELSSFILEVKPNGIDRIVPIGRTSDFSLTWDGYDLIKTLSRECSII